MNYIKHFNHWMELVTEDDRLSSSHISIYVSLFQLWNKNRFVKKMSVHRNEVMQVSKIGSSKTYYKCLHDLHYFGYIQYFPSYHPLKGSTISMIDLSDVEAPNDQDNSEEEEAKKFEYSKGSTRVLDKQKRPSSHGKNATGGTQAVTPLYINNINLLNSKQRERRAREGLNKIIEREKLDTGTSERKKEMSNRAEIRSPKPGSLSTDVLESKVKVPDGFSKPSLEEVRQFFLHQLSGQYLDHVLSSVDRRQEAEKFFYHYENNGWKIGGKVLMKNWNTAWRSWPRSLISPGLQVLSRNILYMFTLFIPTMNHFS